MRIYQSDHVIIELSDEAVMQMSISMHKLLLEIKAERDFYEVRYKTLLKNINAIEE